MQAKDTRASIGWPERQLTGQSRAFSLDVYYLRHIKAQEPTEQAWRAKNYPGSEWLVIYRIPPFQRPIVWSEAQMIRFVESAISGINLGTIVYNDVSRLDAGTHATDFWLIDGQQRLTALTRYFDDGFPVFGRLWSEVPERIRRDFLSTPLPATEVSITEEAELRRLYNLMNFGGVAHTEDQRA